MSLPNYRLYVVIVVMIAAALACNMPTGGGATQAPAEATEAPGEEPGEAVVPTEPPAESITTGFVGTPALDVSTMPTLAIPAIGAEPGFCMGVYDSPAIEAVPVLNDTYQLCLYNFPTAAGSPQFTLTMVSPTGDTYTETYSYVTGEYGLEVVGTTGGLTGYITTAESGAPPGVVVTISTVASVPAGEWMVSAAAADGSYSVPPTPTTIGRAGSLVSILSNSIGNPFATPPNTGTNGDTMAVLGVGFDPSATLTVAFYYADPALGQTEFGTPRLAPRYATTVTTDGAGSFQTAFVIGSDAPTGSYFTVVQPTIEPDTFVDPFTGTFTIE